MGRITRTNFGLTKTRVLTNLETAAIPTHPLTIVPLVVNAILLPIAAFCRLEWAADYSGVDAAAQLVIGVGNTLGSLFLYGAIAEAVGSSVSSLLVSGASASAYFPLIGGVSGSFAPFGFGGYLDTDIVGKPIEISGVNGGMDFGGGDPANMLTVTVFYNVIPVA